MTKAKFTNAQILELHKQYILSGDSMSIAKFARQINCKHDTLYNSFKRLGLYCRPQSITRRKFQIKENYFSKIDNEEKAYFLGLLYADGCNNLKRHRIELSLAKQDAELVIKLSNALLGADNTKEYKRSGNRQNKVGLYIINEKISSDLGLHGCGSRKTFTLKFPKLKSKLIRHFVRGYFDGDGMLSFYKEKTGYQRAQFSIVSTKEMVDEIGVLITKLNIHFKINQRYPKRNNNNYTLRIFGNKQIRKFCNWMYNNSSIFLTRKHANFLKLS